MNTVFEIGKTYRGHVVSFVVENGWGFIRREGGTDADEIFVREPGLREGLQVEFSVEPGRRGRLRATNVRVCA